jgi:hypothetical protein
MDRRTCSTGQSFVCAEILIRFIWPTETPNVGLGCLRCYASSWPYSHRYLSPRADLRQNCLLLGFTEGFDTGDLKEAKALLDTLAA